jgi:hypothetical protein
MSKRFFKISFQFFFRVPSGLFLELFECLSPCSTNPVLRVESLVTSQQDRRMSREVPSDNNCFQIGVIAIVLWSIIFPFSISCYHYAVNRYTKRIFLALIALSLLEMPWALQLTIHRRYVGQFSYSLHLVSSVFFFFTFCTFCFAINDVLRSGEFGLLYIGTMKRKRIRLAMIAVSLLTIVVIMIAIIVLFMSDNLQDYFGKRIYKAFVLFETLEMMALGIFITAFITKLRSKITVDQTFSLTQSSSEASRSKRHNRKMIAVTNKLSIMLFIFMVLFSIHFVRVVWWFSPTNPRYSVDVLAPNSLSQFDFWWWLVCSLLPRAMPPLVFICTMGWPSKYLFHNLIPDQTLSSSRRQRQRQDSYCSSRDSAFSRPRQGSETSSVDDDDNIEGGGRNSLSLQFMKSHALSRSKDLSVDSDDAHHASSLFGGDNIRLSLNEDLLPHQHYSDNNDEVVAMTPISVENNNSYLPPDQP